MKKRSNLFVCLLIISELSNIILAGVEWLLFVGRNYLPELVFLVLVLVFLLLVVRRKNRRNRMEGEEQDQNLNLLIILLLASGVLSPIGVYLLIRSLRKRKEGDKGRETI